MDQILRVINQYILHREYDITEFAREASKLKHFFLLRILETLISTDREFASNF